MDLWEFGLVGHWVKKVTPKAEECLSPKTKNKTIRQVPIYLHDLISAFFILGIGIGLATFCFLLELIVQVRVKQQFYTS